MRYEPGQPVTPLGPPLGEPEYHYDPEGDGYGVQTKAPTVLFVFNRPGNQPPEPPTTMAPT